MPRCKKKNIMICSFGGLTALIIYYLLVVRVESCKPKSLELANPKRHELDSDDTCSANSRFCISRVPAVDIQMLDVYNRSSFHHVPSKQFEQDWCINAEQYNIDPKNKLRVFVVPHSHNDPGWLYTFDEYFEFTTKFILNGMLRNLKEHPDMKFIWAEISFFSRWYEDLYTINKNVVKSLIKNQQLEIVTGGWVMPDEANSHWHSLLIQLIEGQTWLQENLNYTPANAWAIDPFGHSPTMTYILKHAGFKNMVIGRTHYIIKKHLAMYKDLEFSWRQMWDSSKNSDMFTHMLPFGSYAIHYSHGPDKMIGKLFDFRKTEKWYWPWEDRPVDITHENIRERADLLVGQWRKKAALFQANAILVPHGDDFRYSRQEEWDAQRNNLAKLFRYINNVGNYNVDVQFGTLKDYFDFVNSKTTDYTFPSLSGDFFTYSDENEDYWSGYFTTRPYYKRLDRILLHYLNIAEMTYAFRSDVSGNSLLPNIRRALSLFQHHDGITGTARERVVQDYSAQMNQALNNCFTILENDSDGKVMPPYENMQDFSVFQNTEHFLTVFNPLPVIRSEILETYTVSPFVMVLDSSGNIVPSQTVPVFEWTQHNNGLYMPKIKSIKYRVLFKSNVPPLMSLRFQIRTLTKNHALNKIAETIIYTTEQKPNFPKEFVAATNVTFLKSQKFHVNISGSNSYQFNENGLLLKIHYKTATPMNCKIEFLQYLTFGWLQDKSGAYLFRPKGTAIPMSGTKNIVVLTRGSIETRVSVGFEFGVHEVILSNDEIEIRNLIDIGHRDDTEIVMRISSDIDNRHLFYTDLNGFQIIKRQRLDKLPLQATYYPVPSTIFIQDKNYRLTLLSGQPLGGSSLKSGQIELMQDRRLTESDSRGLGEGVMDNRPTVAIFKLVLEDQNHINSIVHHLHPSGFHSNQSYYEQQKLLSPVVRGVNLNLFNKSRTFSMESNGFEIVLLKRLNNGEDVGIILHKNYIEGQYQDAIVTVDLKQLLSLTEGSLHKSSITLLSTEPEELKNFVITLRQMETKAFVIKNAEFN